MRTIALIGFAGLLAFSTAGCRRKERPRIEYTEEGPSQLASVIHMADPKVAVQLIKGFHEVEQNAWRWTTGKFSVTLRPPLNAAQKGAALYVRFTVTDTVIQRVGPVTLSSVVNGRELPPETYSKPGEYVYKKDVPPAALTGDAVSADFSLDKFIAAGVIELRELGIVVSTIGFEAK